ncbi:radical SAM protein [Peptostreptococcus anaerobius]|uniref:elongator complex protein 3 n=1 Tax=Peptostreptococcus TaxID=1257 RepID=UPI00232F80F2|nr:MULTISPECIES: radical SAM protein [Peptostreptococcus]MDB8821780.1 radical SAM protein [Peptostreptococcus anaerobius]MDB8826409.1 radical SAM protein [Peptostreptococcus anaerobius]MDB8828291.1 radical SAM protein [Peptostreptococcus anaerobius]MDB8830037.1 radical SAM protein [Peptostreptococcus anaerobius]MDB8831886.1 radical SAM protein [Peptostreptococcus anaerobius]
MKKKIIPIFVPHQGCPHDCIFCNQKKITGLSTSMTDEDARDIIIESLKTIPDDAEVEIAFFGGSFTAIDTDIQRKLLSVAKDFKDMGKVDDIRLSTRPDCIDDKELDLLKEYGVTIIELGVQSMNEDVLVKSIRGHHRDVVFTSAKMIKVAGFKLGLQMMLGLPGDSKDRCISTARYFVDIKPDFVRIYPTLVIKETGLEEELKSGRYRPFTIEECIDISKRLMVIFYLNDIGVIRVGLQATEDIQLGLDVLAGPYHPAFRELVHSRMVRDYLDDVISRRYEEEGYDPSKSDNCQSFENGYVKIDKKDLLIKANPRDISMIVGDKRSNREYINTKYMTRFKTMADKNLVDELVVMIDGKLVDRITYKDLYMRLAKLYQLG